MNIDNVKSKMSKCVEHFGDYLENVRTGRANIGMLENCLVDAYGSKAKLKELAILTTPDCSQISISPFDRSTSKDILASLNSQDLDMTFSMDDTTIIRAKIPPITEEYKKNVIKRLTKDLEKYKVSIRQIRMVANDEIKQEKSKSIITEDAARMTLKEIDNATSKYTKDLDKVFDHKKRNLMSC